MIIIFAVVIPYCCYTPPPGPARDQYWWKPRGRSRTGVEPERNLQPVRVGHVGGLLHPGPGERGQQHGPRGQRHGRPLWGKQNAARGSKWGYKICASSSKASKGAESRMTLFVLDWYAAHEAYPPTPKSAVFISSLKKQYQIKACLMSAQPASLLWTLINILELEGTDDEMHLFCHFGKEPCRCRPTAFRAHCVNTKQLQSADIDKRQKGGLCQGYRFLGGWDYFFLWWITADITSQNAPNPERKKVCWGLTLRSWSFKVSRHDF